MHRFGATLMGPPVRGFGGSAAEVVDYFGGNLSIHIENAASQSGCGGDKVSGDRLIIGVFGY